MSTSSKTMKNCKHCMTEISRRARICPQCHGALTFSSRVRSFFQTGAWMIAALVSLGFATYEKAEKYGYSERLDAVVNELFIANLTTDVLQDQIAVPAPPPPEFLESGQFAEGGLMMATANGNASYDPTELGRLGQAIQLESAKKTPDLQELKRLIARQQYLMAIRK